VKSSASIFCCFVLSSGLSHVQVQTPRVISTSLLTGLIKAQDFNRRTQQFEFLRHAGQQSRHGLFSQLYVFATADPSPSNAQVTLEGWISADDILSKFSTLYPGKRADQWKNYEVPYAALNPMESLRTLM